MFFFIKKDVKEINIKKGLKVLGNRVWRHGEKRSGKIRCHGLSHKLGKAEGRS